MPRSPEGLWETPDAEREPGRQNRRPIPRRPSRPHHLRPTAARPRRTARAPQPSGKQRARLGRYINQSASSLVGSPAAGGGSYFDLAEMVRLAAIRRLECQTQYSLPVRALGIGRFQYGAAMMSWLLKPWVSGSTTKAVKPLRASLRPRDRRLQSRYRILESRKTSR